jgi:IPTL-CTERM motif
MIKLLLILTISAIGFINDSEAKTTYTFTGPTYTSFNNYVSCLAPNCSNYTTSMRIRGSFTVASPLEPNLSMSDILPQALSWSFNDGVNTISSSGLPAWAPWIRISTDSKGDITSHEIGLSNWQTTAGVNNYINNVLTGTSGGRSNSASLCNEMLSNSECSFLSSNPSSSQALYIGYGTWVSSSIPPAPNPIPTLSEWAQIAMMLMMIAAAGWYMRGMKQR